MKRNGDPFKIIFVLISLLVLIFDSKSALEGARSGIELCTQTVIPSLFPFFVLTTILSDVLSENISDSLQVIGKALGIPKAAASVLISSVLGGYPVGAKNIGDLFRKNQISKNDAERLLMFSNNAGPSFLFGMISVFFPENWMVWLLWIVHIISAVLTAAAIPAVNTDTGCQKIDPDSSRKNVIQSAARAMLLVCCWVILFRIILSYLDRWFLWMLPAWGQVFLAGILELSNGCSQLFLITDMKQRFVICSCMLSFGGICVLLQTSSVIEGLSIGCYIKGKLIQTAFSILLCCMIYSKTGFLFAVMIPVLVLILRKIQNRYSNQKLVPV